MKKVINIMILTFLIGSLYSQSYKSYYKHEYIAEAYLMNQKYDSAAVEYQKAFKQVDYVFVKDLMNTTYLSIILKNDSMFVSSLTKAFCEGLEISDPMIEKNKKIQKYNKSLGNILEEKYDSCRNVYTNTYNLKLRKKLLEMESFDQKAARGKWFHSKEKDLANEKIVFKKNRDELLIIISKYGFPGPQLIGYTDIFPLTTPTGIIVHHLFGDNQLPDSILINAIYTGKYHPYAYGMMYDYHHTNYTLEIPNDKRLQTKAYYSFNPMPVDNDSLVKMVNDYRKEILMPTVQFSQKKYNYRKKHNVEYFILF